MPVDENKKLTGMSANVDSYEQPSQCSSDCVVVPMATSTSTACFSSSDPVLVLSNDSRVPGAVGTIKREVGGRRPSGESNAASQVENKSTAGQDFDNFRSLFFGLYIYIYMFKLLITNISFVNDYLAGLETGSSSVQSKMPSKSQGVVKGQLTELSQPTSASTHVGSSISRPLSNYSSRSQQVIGSQKGMNLKLHLSFIMSLNYLGSSNDF